MEGRGEQCSPQANSEMKKELAAPCMLDNIVYIREY